MQVIDPSSGLALERFEPIGSAEIEQRLERSQRAFLSWRRTSFSERSALLERTAALLRERQQALAERMAREMGKPVRQGRAEVEKCAWVCEHYAEHASAYLRSSPVTLGDDEAFVAYRPLGPVLSIMPWNFPLWQVLRHAAPALMAGNTVLLKHAENVPGCAADVAALFVDAGAPPGVFENLPIDVRIDLPSIQNVIGDPRVRAVTLTGSTRAGRSVGAAAGAALKSTVLELGGSDPYVVLEDADLALAAEACVLSRMINNGQSCVAAKRLIAVAPVYERFAALVERRMAGYALGNPSSEPTDLGPLAREDLRDTLHDQVRRSVEAGARLVLGGEVPQRPGWWYPATVLAEVRPGMAAFDEELFGPVAVLISARDEAHAIELANQTPYGLGAAVFTRDVERGRRIAETELEAGNCFVNSFVKSDPRLPFGGVGESGHGRELAREGILALVNVKTVYISAT